MLAFEDETGTKLHPEHRNLLCEVNGGICRSNYELFDWTIIFPIDRSSSSNLSWMICECYHDGNVPFAEDGNQDILYISPDGAVLREGRVIAGSLPELFQTYFRVVGEGPSQVVGNAPVSSLPEQAPDRVEFSPAANPTSVTLGDLPLLPLGEPIGSAIERYGAPVEINAHETLPEAFRYIFASHQEYEVVINAWDGVIHEIVYWFDKPVLDEDIVFIARHYGEGHQWNTLSRGYLYYRDDEQVRLWCSAVPAVGVGTLAYFKAQSAG
jgi:hypothetical protein